CQQHNSLPTF
nr:immunoglobulin light chain junction region [Macaca mulatta]MOW13549.1 immunoglobulin light chain junction region [Macaca mulatta]